MTKYLFPCQNQQSKILHILLYITLYIDLPTDLALHKLHHLPYT